MVDLRLYRASLLPFVVAALVGAFSLSTLPPAVPSPLPGVAFNGDHAFSSLNKLAAAYPDRAPGSPGDDAFAAHLAAQLRGDGLAVRTVYTNAATADGERRIATVIATRTGVAGRSVVLLADRAGSGGRAALSGTAALLELASVLSQRGADRPLTFVSTSAGSAGAVAAAGAIPRPVQAAIVIGDVAGTQAAAPLVVPWSGNGGAASLVLVRTLDAALAQQLGTSPLRPGVLEQLARFAIPLTVGEQGPLGAAGLPAVLVQQSGELGPARSAPVSAARLTAFGRAILTTVDALQRDGALANPISRDLTLDSDTLAGWVVRLVVGLLILAAALSTLDLLARARRRRLPVSSWLVWTLTWALPFALAGLFAKLLAWSGVPASVPAAPLGGGQPPIGTAGVVSLILVALVFAAGCLARRRLIPTPVGDRDGTGAGRPVALLLVACALAIVLWLANPYTAVLLALPLAVWVPLLAGSSYRSPRVGLLWLLCSLAPLAVVLGVEAHELALGPIAFAWTWLLLFAGGEVGLGALLAASLAGGVIVVVASILLNPDASDPLDDIAITVRGPATYAGPGSLGGTDSALRR